MEKYPETATERFDNANLHIKYCLSFLKKFIKGDVLEVGAGCGSFTKVYKNNSLKTITLTELDKKNITDLEEKYKNEKNVFILKKTINDVDKIFDSIMYLHVLEHIENDSQELKEAALRLRKGGHLIIMAPAHQEIYSNLDKAVGHFRRYEKGFFKEDLAGLNRTKLISIDAIGYFLYYFNRLFFKKEVFPSKTKIFLWDKFFTPITILCDFILRYKFGKCFIAVYKKN